MIAFFKSVGIWLYRKWMAFAHVLGIVNTKVLLTIFYVLIIGPAWLFLTLFRVDSLGKRRKGGDTYWRERPAEDATTETSRHQF